MGKAMILAAGRGERMRPLTDVTPKPLLEVRGKPLIVHHIERLAAAGFKEVVINLAHLGHMIPEALGDGSKWGVKLLYSDEQNEGALESAGGIVKALALLGTEPFLVVNGDVWTDYPFDPAFELGGALAHLVLVPNPEHNPEGDFGIEDNRAVCDAQVKYTFSGMGYYSPEFFKGLAYGKRALGPLLREKMEQGSVTAERYAGVWRDIGTPERLSALNRSGC
jgi:MurNAc alpha-1-phosphate uridylyltransferase